MPSTRVQETAQLSEPEARSLGDLADDGAAVQQRMLDISRSAGAVHLPAARSLEPRNRGRVTIPDSAVELVSDLDAYGD